jgi:hypothetical protein
MHLGWKVMLPTALAFIVVTGTTILVMEQLGLRYGLLYGLILTAVNTGALLLFLFILDRDRIMSGSYSPDREAWLASRQQKRPGLVARDEIKTVPRPREKAGV